MKETKRVGKEEANNLEIAAHDARFIEEDDQCAREYCLTKAIKWTIFR